MVIIACVSHQLSVMGMRTQYALGPDNRVKLKANLKANILAHIIANIRANIKAHIKAHFYQKLKPMVTGQQTLCNGPETPTQWKSDQLLNYRSKYKIGCALCTSYSGTCVCHEK